MFSLTLTTFFGQIKQRNNNLGGFFCNPHPYTVALITISLILHGVWFTLFQTFGYI